MKELDKNELKETNGGWFWLGMLGGFIYDCISDPETCFAGFKDGFNNK